MTDLTDQLDAIQKRLSAFSDWPGINPTPQADVALLLVLARKQQAAIDAVRRMHGPEMASGRDGNGVTDYCPACSTYWPCPTMEALEAKP